MPPLLIAVAGLAVGFALAWLGWAVIDALFDIFN